MDKYETFKQATFELLQTGGQTGVYDALQDIATAIEKDQSDQANEPIMTLEELNKLTYKERLTLAQNDPGEYARIIGGMN